MRRSLLFIPSNSPRMIQNADVFESDGIIFDLEDAVSIQDKDSANYLIKEAFGFFNFEGEKIVRINDVSTPYYVRDIELIKQIDIDTILLPKSTLETINRLKEDLAGTNIKVIALIESALGIEESFEIAKVDIVNGLLLGGEDLSVDLGVKRTKVGTEILYQRLRIVNAAKACNIDVIDTPFLDVDDTEGLLADTLYCKNVGFTGKAAINPRQVIYIQRTFTPTDKEVKDARLLLNAYNKSVEEGLAVFNYNGKMVDLPVVKRAQQILDIVDKEK